MTQAVATQDAAGRAVANKVASPIQSVREALERMKPRFEVTLPKHLTADRLCRVALTACQNTPKLLDCDRKSLFSAITLRAQLGLEPDGVLGQAYLVPFAGKVQFIPGYKGLITLARNSGDVSSIVAHEVCEKDEFDLNERCRHKPASGDRGEITGFYAIARFKDGGYHWDYMTRADVETIRNRSSGWQAAVKFKKEKDSPWSAHFAEMGKKTVIRRISKYLPMSVQKLAALDAAAEAGYIAHIDGLGVSEPTVSARRSRKGRGAHESRDGLARRKPERLGAVDRCDRFAPRALSGRCRASRHRRDDRPAQVVS